MKKKPALIIKDEIYPNGQPYKRVLWGDRPIGTYEAVEGGFLPLGCRKVLPSEQDAQFKLAQRYMARHLKEAAEAVKIMDEIMGSRV